MEEKKYVPPPHFEDKSGEAQAGPTQLYLATWNINVIICNIYAHGFLWRLALPTFKWSLRQTCQYSPLRLSDILLNWCEEQSICFQIDDNI